MINPGSLINVPYSTSPPLLFTYRQSATVAAGTYDFTGTSAKTPFTPSRPILPNFLYLFSTISFSMDIDEGDYFGAIATQPEFSLYMLSDAAAPQFREPLALATYLKLFPYIFPIFGQELMQAAQTNAVATVTPNNATPFNRLLGLVKGSLNQTANLLGKGTITAIVQFTAQEIVDDTYINQFKQSRPGYAGSRSPDNIPSLKGRVFE